MTKSGSGFRSFGAIVVLGLVVLASFAIGQGDNQAAAIASIVFFGGSAVLYLAPSMVALQNKRENATAIVILNVLLGWTVLGWIGALVWAHSSGNRLGEASLSTAPPKTTDSESRRCPFCAETILVAAIKCKHCGSEIVHAAIQQSEPPTSPKKLMEDLGISFDGEKYVFQAYRYDRQEDAIAYAKKMRRTFDL